MSDNTITANGIEFVVCDADVECEWCGEAGDTGSGPVVQMDDIVAHVACGGSADHGALATQVKKIVVPAGGGAVRLDKDLVLESISDYFVNAVAGEDTPDTWDELIADVATWVHADVALDEDIAEDIDE